MSFTAAIRTCLSKYATFTGRARRSEFWYFYLFVMLLDIVVVVASPSSLQTPLEALVGLVVLLPNLAVSVRRLHDTGRSGWWLLIGLIPLAGPIILIVLFASDTTYSGNEYGPAPKPLPMYPPI